MSHAYRYLAFDLLPDEDGVRAMRATLPLDSVRYGHVLNRPGTLTATADLRSAHVTPNVLDEGRTVLAVERDETIVWAGVLWATMPDLVEQTVQLHAQGFHSLLAGAGGNERIITHTLNYSQVGQLDILRGLVNYAQDETLNGAGANVAIEAPAGAPGRLRDRSWRPSDGKNLGEAMTDLTEVIDGPDFRYHTSWAQHPTLGTRYLRTEFLPADRLGRRTNHVVRAGKNTIGLTIERDATRMARRVHGFGAGQGDDQLRVVASAAEPGYPLMDTRVSHPDVMRRTTLAAHAESALAARRRPVRVPMPVTAGNREPSISTYIEGDELQLVDETGWLGSGWYRVLARDIAVPDDSTRSTAGEALGEEVTLTLEPV